MAALGMPRRGKVNLGECRQRAVHVGRGEIVWQDRCHAANGSKEPFRDLGFRASPFKPMRWPSFFAAAKSCQRFPETGHSQTIFRNGRANGGSAGINCRDAIDLNGVTCHPTLVTTRTSLLNIATKVLFQVAVHLCDMLEILCEQARQSFGNRYGTVLPTGAANRHSQTSFSRGSVQWDPAFK